MIWACFTATGPGKLPVIEATMNSMLYQNVLETNVRPSVQQLGLWNRRMIPSTPVQPTPEQQQKIKVK